MVFRSWKLSVAPLWPFRYPHHMVQLFQVPLSWLTMRILPLLSQVCLLVLPLLRSRMVFVWLFRGSNSQSTRSSHGTLGVLLTSFQALLASMQCLHMLWPRSAPPRSTFNLAMTKQCSTLSPDFFGSDQLRMDWNRPSSRHVTLPTSPFIAPLCLVLRPPGMAFPSLVLRHRPALKSPPAKISLCLLSKDTLAFKLDWRRSHRHTPGHIRLKSHWPYHSHHRMMTLRRSVHLKLCLHSLFLRNFLQKMIWVWVALDNWLWIQRVAKVLSPWFCWVHLRAFPLFHLLHSVTATCMAPVYFSFSVFLPAFWL